MLPGSRRQEIKDFLPARLEAASAYSDRYAVVVAGAPGIEPDYYHRVMGSAGRSVSIVHGQTYRLLACAAAAVVTSGTATLETALFGVPQVVCYKTPLPRLVSFLRRHLLKVKYVSLVNLICDGEVVRELVASSFSVANIRSELGGILPGGAEAARMKEDYRELRRRLGTGDAADNAARLMVTRLTGR